MMLLDHNKDLSIYAMENSIVLYLRRREIKGHAVLRRKQILRETAGKCYSCDKPIYAVILDLNEDKDIFDFRYHYYVPCYKCIDCDHKLFDV